MANFTLIFHIRGKISIRQVAAASPQAALKKVVPKTDTKKTILKMLADSKVTPIGDLIGCWFSSAPEGRKFALAIIIRTAN